MPIRDHALYRLLPQPPGDAAQGACYLTGSGGECVDTGVNIWNEGTLVISKGAVRELAEVAGYDVVDGLELETRNAELVKENAELAQRINDLEDELDIAARLQARKQKAAR
jgi:hypothetical protein